MKSGMMKAFKKYGLYRVLHFGLRKTIIKNGLNIDEILKAARSSEGLKEFRSTSKFLFSGEKAKMYFENNDGAMVVQTANDICCHKYQILGESKVDFGEDINWLRDYKSGFIWNESEKVNRDSGTDIKRIWDLSRFYQLPVLGKAYLATGDERYYREFVSELVSWVEQNQFTKSINWSCSMEISIRTVNLICAAVLFEEKIDEHIRYVINEQIFLGGSYIRNHLEDDCLTPNNHFITDLVGLIFIGLYFQNLKGSLASSCAGWLRYAIKTLQKELKREVCDDGCSYEKSTSYHSYVTELVLCAAMVLKANAIDIKEETMRIIERMVDFCSSISCGGNMPLFGDQDDSRLLRLDNHYPNDNILMTNYLTAGLSNLKEGDYSEVTWLFEADGVKEAALVHHQFPSAGYFILKNDLFQVDVICGELSCLGTGGHSHNDQLSFVAYYKGIPITVDSGTYCYTESEIERNHFRSTSSHSTVCIDDAEQNVFQKGKFFVLNDITRSKCIRATKDFFKGEHFGYVDRFGVTHKRAINIENNRLHVLDEICGNSQLPAVTNIILDAGAIQTGSHTFRVNNVDIELFSDSNIVIQVRKIWISHRYGRKKEALKISIPFCSRCKYTIGIGERNAYKV